MSPRQPKKPARPKRSAKAPKKRDPHDPCKAQEEYLHGVIAKLRETADRAQLEAQMWKGQRDLCESAFAGVQKEAERRVEAAEAKVAEVERELEKQTHLHKLDHSLADQWQAKRDEAEQRAEAAEKERDEARALAKSKAEAFDFTCQQVIAAEKRAQEAEAERDRLNVCLTKATEVGDVAYAAQIRALERATAAEKEQRRLIQLYERERGIAEAAEQRAQEAEAEVERLRVCESVSHHEEHHAKERRWGVRHKEVFEQLTAAERRAAVAENATITIAKNHAEKELALSKAEARVRSLEEALREMQDGYCWVLCLRREDRDPADDMNHTARCLNARAALSETTPAEPASPPHAGAAAMSGGASPAGATPAPGPSPAEPASPETKPRPKQIWKEWGGNEPLHTGALAMDETAAPPEPRNEERCECGHGRSLHGGGLRLSCVEGMDEWGRDCPCEFFRPAAGLSVSKTLFEPDRNAARRALDVVESMRLAATKAPECKHSHVRGALICVACKAIVGAGWDSKKVAAAVQVEREFGIVGGLVILTAAALQWRADQKTKPPRRRP